jgi:hypothetical protein
MNEVHAGQDVFIWGGVSDLAHGKVDRVDAATYERPFAFVRLRRKDGKLSKSSTMVPTSRCVPLPAEYIAKTEAERQEWMKKWKRELAAA